MSWKDPVSGNWTDATKWSTGTAPTLGDDVVIDADGSYTVTLNALASIASLTLGRVSGATTQTLQITGGGTLAPGSVSAVRFRGVLHVSGGSLSGAGDVDIDGLLRWTGGTISGSGALTVAAAGMLHLGPGGDLTLDGRTLTSNGNGFSLLTAFNDVFLRNNAKIVNNGTFDIQGDNAFDLNDASTPEFSNSGTLRKSTNAGTATIDVRFVNSGTVETSSGVLQLTRSSEIGGAITGNATLLFPSGTHTFDGLTIAGAGGARLTGGTISTSNAGATVGPSGRFQFAGGTFAGSGPLVVQGRMDWTGGTVTGSGALTVSQSGTLNLGPGGDLTLDGRTVTNAGTMVSYLTAFNDVFMRSNAIIDNDGTFEIQGDNALDLGDGTAPQIINAGTLIKSTSANNAIIDVQLINSGTLEITSGVLDLRRSSMLGGSVTGSATVLCSSGNHILDGVSVAGAGGLRLTGGTMSTNGAGAAVAPGGRIHIAGGTLSGSAPLIVDGTLDWTAGTISGSGAFTINGTLNFGPGSDVFLDGRTINNTGTIVSYLTPNNDIFLRSNAMILNSGTFDIQGQNAIDLGDASAPMFINSGIFRRSVSATTTHVDVMFSNSGTVSAESGTLNFTRGFTQSAGVTVLNGGGISSNGTLNFQGGAVAGSGVLTADVSSGGEISPGLSPGSITITKNFAQTASGLTRIELDGLAPGTEFDRILMNGSGIGVSLSGNLVVELLPGFVPAIGDSFVLLNAPNGTITGNFTSTQFPAVPGVGFQLVVAAKSVTLNAVAPASPTSTSTASPAATSSSTPSRTPSSSPTPPPSQSPTHTASATRTLTASAVPTATSSHTLTVSPSSSPTRTPTSTHSVTATFTSTPTPVATATLTATAARSSTATRSPTRTFTASATPTPTFSFTASPTHTPSQTASFTATVTPVNTSTRTPTTTATVAPATASATATPSPENTATLTATHSAAPSATHSPAATATPTPSPTTSPTPSSTATVGVNDLPVSGICLQPGSTGLIGCRAGTVVTVFRCNNVSCIEASLTALGDTTTNVAGLFEVLLDGREARGARLLFEARVDDTEPAPLSFVPRVETTATPYRAIDFGPVAQGTRLSDVRIGPSSEATVRLLEDTGAEMYADATIRDLIAAVDAATRDETFAGEDAADAADLAVELVRTEPQVQELSLNTRPFCQGDCNDDRLVTVDEVVVLVNIALGNTSVARCTAGNASTEAMITVDELVRAIARALNACPA